MPETSQTNFWLPGESGGIVIKGRALGASFPKICILDIFGNISSNLSLDRRQKHPKKFFDSQGGPGGARGASKKGATRGTVFFKSTVLVLLVVILICL